MLVPEVHPYGGTWLFYVIAPVVLCGFVTSLWWIVKGAIGVFGPRPDIAGYAAGLTAATRTLYPRDARKQIRRSVGACPRSPLRRA